MPFSTTHEKSERDAGRVYEVLIGKPLPSLPSGFHREELFFDAESGEGGLVDFVLDSFHNFDRSDPASFYRLSQGLVDMSCPFHRSQALFESPWRRDFHHGIDRMLYELPFIYSEEKRIETLDRRSLILWVRRSADAGLRVIDAYKYGNGFPALRDLVRDQYNQTVNLVLHGWLFSVSHTSNSATP